MPQALLLLNYVGLHGTQCAVPIWLIVGFFFPLHIYVYVVCMRVCMHI